MFDILHRIGANRKCLRKGKFLVVVYREGEGSGFVVTAFFTRRAASLSRRRQLWPS